MRNKLIPLILCAMALMTHGPARAAEITACVVDTNLNANATYFHRPTISTKLLCDLDRGADFRPSLQMLYKEGWRLIQVIDPNLLNPQTQRRVSPVFYLERETKPKS